MAELIAVNTAQADSADVTLVITAAATFLLKGGSDSNLPRGTVALLQAKSGTQYITVGQLDDTKPMLVVNAAGVFRVRKLASVIAVGVDQN